MANRRSGGMGGGPRGNRGSYSSYQGSPWQGASNSQCFMSQIPSNPQQLALALTSLLQPQQNNPPSLLSLNTSGFSNQDRGYGRFGNRGREMRRVEPYNKNRGGWGRDRKRNQNRKDGKKDEKKEGGENAPEKNKDGEHEEKHGDKEGPYAGVPMKLMNCFVCCKEMWDGESMKKHLKGRAHRQMMESLEESIHCIVNILREHMRVAEEKKVIEMQRLHRLNKKGGRGREPESHCNMCDMKFLGKIVSHRKTEGHQRLKRYLHPTCGLCDKEFPSRMDWIEHRLTPEHLRKLADSLNNRCGGANGDIIIWEDEEVQEKEQKDEENEDNAEPEAEAKPEEEAEEGAEQAEKKEVKDTKKIPEIQSESDSPILEMTDDLEQLQNLPMFKPERALSVSSLKPFTGFICQLCDRTFETEELSQNHLKTKIHYYAFVDAAKSLYRDEIQKKDEAKKKQDDTQESEVKENGDSEMYDPEEACNDNEDSKEEVGETTEEQAEAQENEGENEDVEMVEEVKEEVKEEPKVQATSTPVRATKAKRGRK